LHGTLRDASARPVAAAPVTLESEATKSSRSIKTNADGTFSFSALPEGSYRVTAETSAHDAQATATVTLATGDSRQVDLALAPSSAASNAAAEAMQFADKPSFTVAGVTDWTAVGGHGSDTTLRASESLARDTITLQSRESSAAQSGTDRNRADQHRAAGDAAEKRGDPLTAVREYEQAASIDPSEQNYFSWGSELLLHRAVWQARQVFTKGVEAHPGSARMLLALGAALFAGDVYDEAASRVCAASDLDPRSAAAYLYLGRIDMAAPVPLDCALTRLERFAHQEPGNALADYYLAMALLKRLPPTPAAVATKPARNLLLKAVDADPQCAEAYLQLGILAFAQRDSAGAIDFYSRAIAANPKLGEAHYRLAVAYDRSGKPEEARREFAAHDRIEKEELDKVERQRREIKQFLIVLNAAPTAPANP
jgi:tetratricopeptide (TPR) repeat protein